MHDILKDTLARSFGHESFRPGQREVVETLLAGGDVLAVMPTGSGKSLCYQLPALLLPGVTLVVSPLIALMKDQVDALRARGLPATFINSDLEAGEAERRLAEVIEGRHKLLYVAPERLRGDRFLEALASTRVSLFAVDEAHCISRWGHDFRPDYARLGRLAARFGRPPVGAFTATATPAVRADIRVCLGLESGRETVVGLDRPNLRLRVVSASGPAAKLAAALVALRRSGVVPTDGDVPRDSAVGGSAVVYCATRRNVEAAAAGLQRSGVVAEPYHAGLPKERRREIQDRFMADDLPVVVATNAFGLGIDKPDIRVVIHHDVPGSVEAYWQEAGRAGRDGLPAECLLLFRARDLKTQEFFVDLANPRAEDLEAVLRVILRAAVPVVEFDPAALASAFPGLSGAGGIEAAVKVLEREGVVWRLPASFGRMRLRILRREEPLPVDFAGLAEKRMADLARLARMVEYVESPGCRRRNVLAYFGETTGAERCGACDRCA